MFFNRIVNSTCQTPDQMNGTCVPLLECELLWNKIHSTDADKEFLRQSDCGFVNLDPLVNLIHCVYYIIMN